MLLVDRLEEMLRLEEIGDAVERLVVDQDGAEQRLLRLDIVRRRAVCAAPAGSCLRAVESNIAMVPIRGFAMWPNWGYSTSRFTQRRDRRYRSYDISRHPGAEATRACAFDSQRRGGWAIARLAAVPDTHRHAIAR